MKIYINKNCSGFHWFEGDFSSNEEVLKMNYAQPVSEGMKLLEKIMLYAQYEVCLAHENRVYILSLNNIPEKERKDSFGRPLSMQLVFVDENLELLWKVLFLRLQQFEEFSEEISKCFAAVIAADPPYVRCRKALLESIFSSCFQKALSQDAEQVVAKASGRLLFVNSDSRTTMKNIGFSENEVLNAEHSLRQCEQMQWLVDSVSEPPISKDELEKKIKELEEKIRELESQDYIKVLKEEIDKLKGGLVHERLSNSILSEVNNKLQENIKQLEKKIEELKDSENVSDKSLLERIKGLESKISELKSENEDLLRDRTEIHKLIEEKNKTILRFKLISIGLGIVSVLLLVFYLFK